MATLTADAGSFVLSGALAPRLWAEAGAFTLSATDTELNREYDVDLGNLTLRLDRLQAQAKYYNPDGTPTRLGQTYWQRHCEAIETAFNSLRDAVAAIQAAYNAAAQATTAAATAQAAVVEVQAVADQAQQVVTDLQNGDLNLDAITVGGQKFVYDQGADGLVSYQ
jgi:hypothetical protein